MTDPGTSRLCADLRALPRPVLFLLAGSVVNRFGSFVLPFLALYLTHGGYSVAQAGLALSAYGIGSASAAAAGGVLADLVGRRGTIALSMYSSAVVMLALSPGHGGAGGEADCTGRRPARSSPTSCRRGGG